MVIHATINTSRCTVPRSQGAQKCHDVGHVAAVAVALRTAPSTAARLSLPVKAEAVLALPKTAARLLFPSAASTPWRSPR